MKVSLRTSLVGLWLLIVVICAALAILMGGLFQLGVGAEVKSVEAEAQKAVQALDERFRLYLVSYNAPIKTFGDAQRRQELGLILQLVLADYKKVEGGFWSETNGFIAYAYPTYEGEVPKMDVPPAEQGRIAKMAAETIRTRAPQERRFDGDSESLILCARPVGDTKHPLAVWTMSRAHVSAGAAYQRITIGFAVLLFLALASGGWLLWFLQRWSQRVSALEEAIAAASIDELPPLPETGQKELDRIVMALNGLSEKLKRSRDESRALSKNLAKADRMVAVGRMAAEVAHEIRNPIAAMRLRMENALAKSAEHQRGAIEFSLQEIKRLDELLERLLAVTRLEELKPKSVKLKPWVSERLDALRDRAEQVGVELLQDVADLEWVFDSHSLGRALDNLLLNGLQHTPRGGAIKVTVEQTSKICNIMVDDTGPGVPPAERESIFESLRTTRREGIGLGLGIAREIVEAHGGVLRCVDGTIGARFEMELPWRQS